MTIIRGVEVNTLSKIVENRKVGCGKVFDVALSPSSVDGNCCIAEEFVAVNLAESIEYKDTFLTSPNLFDVAVLILTPG